MIAVEGSDRSSEPKGTLQAGAMLDNYRLMSRLAAGNATEVWLAKMTGAQGFEKAIALKAMRPESARSPDSVRAFTNEAAIAAKLYHPNIVQLVDFERADGRYYIAMEYLPGATLRGMLERLRAPGRPFPLALLAHIAQQVCAGLHYAHELIEKNEWLGILHRDVSPENVIVSPTGAVKLIDFGAARLAASPPAPVPLGGKLRYLAPERLRGLPEDRRSDVYSVGAVLYECLTGTPPFFGDDLTLASRIMAGKVLDPRTLAGDLPDEIVRITLRAMATAPEDRHSSADQLALDLEIFEDHCYSIDRGTVRADSEREELTPMVDVSALRADLGNDDITRLSPPPPVPEAVVEVRPSESGRSPEPRPSPFVFDRPPTPASGIDVFAVRRAAVAPGPLPWRIKDGASPPAVARPADPRAVRCFDRGLAYLAEKRYGLALAEWEEACALDPENRTYRTNLKRLLARQPRREETESE
jgi:serine/threonine protein kinase